MEQDCSFAEIDWCDWRLDSDKGKLQALSKAGQCDRRNGVICSSSILRIYLTEVANEKHEGEVDREQ